MLALLAVSGWLLGAEPSPDAGSFAPPKTAIVLDGIALSPDVSPRVAGKASELLAHDLAATGTSVWSREQLETLRNGASELHPPDLASARTELEDGKRLYLEVQFEAAAKQLDLARQAYLTALPATGDFAPLQDALTYLAASQQGLGQSAAVDETFNQLLQFRPGFDLDARTFPPDLVNAFTARKQAVAKGPHATLSVASAPPLATVTLDGERRGETPLVLSDLLPGHHVVRIEAAGYRMATQEVEVAVPRSEVEVHLEPSRAGDELRALEEEARGPGERALLARQAAALAREAGVDAVVVVGVGKVSDGLLVSAAMVDTSATPRLAWTLTDANMLGAADSSRDLVRKLMTVPGPVFAGPGAQPAAPLDFTTRLLGFTPISDAPPAPAVEASSTPFYQHWYFWAGVVVVGAAAGVGGYALLHHGTTTVQGPDTTTLDVQVQP